MRAGIEQQLNYQFQQPALLRQALTHRSHSQPHNERLEFLGDSVLNCVVAQMLYERYGNENEGDLSRIRANLVQQQALFELTQKLNLAKHLRLGEGELKSGGLQRPSILADTLEALFGAVFLDGGFTAAAEVVRHLYAPLLANLQADAFGKDPKTQLQEFLQARKIPVPTYTVVEISGAAHIQVFEVECAIPRLEMTVRGTGNSRRAGEQAAAKVALLEVEKKVAGLLSSKSSTKARSSKSKAAISITEKHADNRADRDVTKEVSNKPILRKKSDDSVATTVTAAASTPLSNPTNHKKTTHTTGDTDPTETSV